MIKNFKVILEGAEFKFNTMHILKLQLFQVYVQHDNREVRFHMKININGSFEIADKNKCPQEYLHLEKEMSDAIFQHGN